MAVKLIIDSASDISKKEAKKLGITMVPMTISFGEEEFFDGVNLSTEEFYRKLTEGSFFPKTAQIPPFRFEKTFKDATADGSSVIVITLSSKLSGTYESALTASKNFDGKVFVVDTVSVATGERLLCYHALKLIREGKSAQEVYDELQNIKGRVHIMAVLDTLEFLKKGGRISSAVAFVGGLLNLKPVVELVGGEVKMVGKAMGLKKGVQLLNSIVGNYGGIDFSMPYGVLWTGLDESIADDYIKQSPSVFSEGQANKYILGSTIGTHVGPGVVGVAFFSKEEQ